MESLHDVKLSDMTEGEQAIWRRLLSEQVSMYRQFCEQRYMLYDREHKRSRYPESMAERAYAMWCAESGVPLIEAGPDRDGNKQGVYMSAHTRPDTILTLAGIRAVWALALGEYQKCRRSIGYAWSVQPSYVDISHTPRARLAAVIRALWPILHEMVEPVGPFGRRDWKRWHARIDEAREETIRASEAIRARLAVKGGES